MIGTVICTGDKLERRLLDACCREQVALHSEEPLRVEYAENSAELQRISENKMPVDLLYFEYRDGQSLSSLRTFRKHYGSIMVMLITEASVSPLEYLRPGVAPDGLLLRPLDRAQTERANREFLEEFFARLRLSPQQESFIIESRQDKIYVPYSKIYYFEARDKRLYARTLHREYAFYGTLDQLLDRLPEGFVRCHRSYIVNVEKIVRIVYTENYLELAEGLGIPASRGFRSALKERLK